MVYVVYEESILELIVMQHCAGYSARTYYSNALGLFAKLPERLKAPKAVFLGYQQHEDIGICT